MFLFAEWLLAKLWSALRSGRKMPFRHWKIILVTSVFLPTLFPLRSAEALREPDSFANNLPSLLLNTPADDKMKY